MVFIEHSYEEWMNRGEEVEITSLIFFFQETSCEIKEEIAKEEKYKGNVICRRMNGKDKEFGYWCNEFANVFAEYKVNSDF